MKKYLLLISCIFILKTNAQTGNKKDVFAFTITDYTVAVSDSVTLVQVELPLGFNAVIEKEQVGLIRHNYSNSKDTAEIGWGKCQLIKGNYYYFAMHLHNITVKPQKSDLLYTMSPEEVFFLQPSNRHMATIKNGIFISTLLNVDNRFFITVARYEIFSRILRQAQYSRRGKASLRGSENYILSGTSIPNRCIPLLITLAVIEASCKRTCFFSSVSALAIECSV